MPALAIGIVRVDPFAVVEHDPERVAINHGQVGNNADENVRHTLIVKRSRQMMVIDDIETLVRPMNHRDHMSAQKLILLFTGFVLPPALALFFHLFHSDGHLRRTERKNRNWMNDRLPHMRHDLNSSVGLQKSCCNPGDYVKIPPTINRPRPGRDRQNHVCLCPHRTSTADRIVSSPASGQFGGFGIERS
jgi:hypothetical protein